MPEQDLAQEVYLKMFSRLDRYQARPGIPFEHWLSRLAVRTCLDVLRAESRRPQPFPLSEAALEWVSFLTRDEPQPVDEVLAAQELVDALLTELPPADRLVLSLLDLEGNSLAEVAQITGWSTTLVKVRAFRARGRLRGVLRARARRPR